MRVVFIIPPQANYLGAGPHELTDRGREARPNLGILYVATYLLMKKHRNVTATIIDCAALGMNYPELEKSVIAEKPDIVGITALTFTYLDALKTAQMVKQVDLAIKVCLGGIHPTLYPYETLMQDCIDYIVQGEGEVTFEELLLCLENGGSLHDVDGLGFKDNGRIVLNEPRELIDDLNALPFPNYDLVNVKRYSHLLGSADITLPIQSSRGCPFCCTFCDIRKTRYRYRSAENVVDEIHELLMHGINSLFFIDDNFTLHRERVIDICRMIVARNLKVSFKVSSRGDALDEDVLRWLKKAGCSRIHLGVETCHQKYLDYLQKGIKVERIVDAIKTAHDQGLGICAYVIIGFPGETWEEMIEEVSFLKNLKVEYAGFSLLVIYPKTYLHQDALKRGQMKSDVWQAYAINPNQAFCIPVVNTEHSIEALRKLQHLLTLRFYGSLNSALCRLREVRNVGQLIRYAKMASKILIGL